MNAVSTQSYKCSLFSNLKQDLSRGGLVWGLKPSTPLIPPSGEGQNDPALPVILYLLSHTPYPDLWLSIHLRSTSEIFRSGHKPTVE